MVTPARVMGFTEGNLPWVGFGLGFRSFDRPRLHSKCLPWVILEVNLHFGGQLANLGNKNGLPFVEQRPAGSKLDMRRESRKIAAGVGDSYPGSYIQSILEEISSLKSCERRTKD